MAKKPIKSINLLPEFLRTDKNSKFLSSTIDQLIQPANLERIDGFIGSKFTPTYVSTSDVYIAESLPLRRDYQLEPALVIKDNLDNIKQVIAIDDLANTITTDGGFDNDFDRLFRTEFYSFNPQIDVDKFVNYQKYYWLITGPDTIVVTGKQIDSTSTYSVVDNEIKSAWIFSPDGLTEDPTIVLYRGNNYNFSVTSEYPFYIKTAPSLGLDDVYSINVLNNGDKNGVVSIVVDENTPAVLYYTSDDVNFVQGKFVIKESVEDSFVDVEKEILGKKTYTSGTGIVFSNGMKIRFEGGVYPETYKNKEFFVEGVGNSIRLIDVSLLIGFNQLAAQFDDDFDASNFDQYPFDNFQQLPLTPEYITINRASNDLNPWSRYNRWVHEDIIKLSAELNGITPVIPADKRAKRPIIEFVSDLQLYNFGSIGTKNVDLIDNDTLDAFSFVEGSAGYYIDGVLLEQGHRVIFNADTDDLVRGKIYEVNFIRINNIPRIELKPAEDHVPPVRASLSTNLGLTIKGKSWWFDGNSWILSQQHDSLNQEPLFDLFDNNGISYSSNFYNTNFKGSKIFGYQRGSGNNDPVLGFPLNYQNTISVGSYKFKNYFSTDEISLFENNQITKISTKIAYLKLNKQTPEFVNVWAISDPYEIPILQLFSTIEETEAIELRAIDNPTSVNFTLQVYVNNKKITNDKFFISFVSNRCFVVFNEMLPANQNVVFKIFTKELANSNGQYETPISLTNNPLNDPIGTITLTSFSDHLKSMTERDPEFIGDTFGNNNIRDLPNIVKYGTRLVSNANPIAFAQFFLGNKKYNLINAIQTSADQYYQFKLSFLRKLSEIGNINDPITAVDNVLTALNNNKDLNTPWYYSDMVGYGADKLTRTWTITDKKNDTYPIISDFDPYKLSLRSVLVYLNNNQLILDKDYEFLINESNVKLLTSFEVGDELRVEDYFSTEGSYIPATPSKLGLYPKFEPTIYLDNSYVTPTNVIQGHDGSLTVAFNDFRDAAILEFEKRIFNNIKSTYNREILDINTILPGSFRETDYSIEEINTILRADFIKWAGTNNVDYSTNSTFDNENSFTWNYTGSLSTNNVEVTGYWRSFFKFFYDTDRPNTHPWEMLGFSLEPIWWKDQYGSAPYTSGNSILWEDLEKGIIRQGPNVGTTSLYARPGLSTILPVDEYGNLVRPDQTFITNILPYNTRQPWQFGDHAPAETAWRRSSYWPFAVQRLIALTKPALYSSLFYDPSRLTKNVANQWTYGDNREFLDLRKIKISGDQNTLTSGYSAFVSEIGTQQNSNYISQIKDDLAYSKFNLFHKVGGFVSKNKLQIIIDAIEPNSTSPGALLPQENYKLFLNVSNPIKNARISGVIVQKSNGNLLIKGYDTSNPYFTILRPTRNSNTPSITVGGVSESFVVWAPSASGGETGLADADITTALPAAVGNFYRQGQLVKYGNNFYRTTVSHRAEATFNPAYFQLLKSVPLIGGATVQIANNFSTVPENISYGMEFNNIQDVYDVLIGYGKWLESQGFIFDDFNSDINEVVNWGLSAKEFLFWTTQNWADNSIITLSPFASKLKYTLPNSIVDNIFDSFYEYSIFKADGLPLPEKKINVNRIDGICILETIGTADGMYFATLNSVQKEHAMVFDSTTIFNDTIYDAETGYRQRRVKLVGFRTSKWNGDYFSPGFVFDRAEINDWKKYTSYIYGDTVRYNGNYYSAKQNISGATTFDFTAWVLLNEKPVPDLIPNFEYKINQFEDFYSLDIDNFDDAQQKMAQHLIGYTPRVYLNNVFTNPISQYKFYQGFIKEKGTRNSIEKLAKASIFNLQGETNYTEEWALRIGQYGAYPSYQEIEISLEEGTFIENPQIINFVESKPTLPIDLIYYSTSTNLAITPDDYSPETTFTITTSSNFQLPIAGYVNFEDVTATAYNENSLLDIANANQINNGDVIWLGFKANGSWDVVRYELLSARVTGVFVSSPGEEITFVTDTFHRLSLGDIVSIARFNEQVNGVYTVKSIPKLNQITVASDLLSITNEDLLSPGLIYKFVSVRSSNFDNLPEDHQMLRAPYGSKFWIDNETNDGRFNWEVYEKINNFSNRKIQAGYTVSNQEFGYSISKSFDSDIFVVGAPKYSTLIDNGKVFLYFKQGQNSLRAFGYSLNSGIDQYHSSAEQTNFGHSVAYWPNSFYGANYGLVFAGAPVVSNLKERGFNLRYSDGTGSVTTSSMRGAVKITSIDSLTTNEKTELVLLSPDLTNYQQFGFSLSIGKDSNNIFVGAPGTKTTGTGVVYRYNVMPPVSGHIVTADITTTSNRIYINSTDGISIGNNIAVKGIFDNILSGPKVQSIYDDGSETYIVLDQLPTSSVVFSETATIIVRFYNTANIAANNNGVYTSTNGILFSFVSTITSLVSNTGDEFGYSIDSSDDGKISVFSAPGRNYVETYIDQGTMGIIRATHTTPFEIGTGTRFGESVSLSRSGEYMFVGAPYLKNSDDSFGKVAIYQRIGTVFTYTGYISNPLPGASMNFGQEIDIDPNTTTLVISSVGLNKFVPVEFDNEITSFDSSSTNFFTVIENFGTVYVYNRHTNSQRFVLVEELLPEFEAGTDLKGTNFGFSILVDNDTIFVGAPSIDAVTTSSFYQFDKIDKNKNSLNLYKQYNNLTDTDTIQKIRLIDTFNETVVDYLDVIDPIKGKIAGLADQEIKYKSAYDPAIYSIGTAGVVVDSEISWLDSHVGELWWDLSTVKYVWYEQGDLTYRKNNWGALFPGATIDVYEWVRSTYLPSEWSINADTSEGLTEGISGQPKFVDNSAIAVKQVYNPVSNSFSNVYYYWVKNKVTVPDAKNRRISAYQVSNIIADPAGFGLKFAAILSNDAIALSNVGPLLVDNRIHLNISYDAIKNTIPKHTEWVLLNEGDANSTPPSLYEKKLFDSLLGRDRLGNLVPDPSLTERVRYGISIRPRQTLFKNRRNALRELIEFTNQVLNLNQITGRYSFTNLNSQEFPPDEFSNQYDQTVEDNEGLNIVDTIGLKRAKLTATVNNGKLTSVSILDSGYGYKIAPNVIIENNLFNAEIETEIDVLGRISSVRIINPGRNFNSAPSLTVRPYTVIVLPDSSYNGKWTKFEWDEITKQWERTQTQKYNTTLYWEYIDWRSASYNEFISFTDTVDQVYQLDTLEDLIQGQYVKIKNAGDGRYIIVEKTGDGDPGTFGKGFNLVYSEKGTIQILNKIWNVRENNLNYDQDNNYDQTLYDQTPDIELEYILKALKEDIFINELKINWNLFFFKAIKYALTEQKLLDWAFKTSFINVTNYAGILDQRPVYKLQTSENYEKYIREVKPYHTQIRTFTANHQIVDPSNSFITDFDLPSYYNSITDNFEIVEQGSSVIEQLPWKTWNENYLYNVGNIEVGFGGSGYTYPPQVIIETAPGDTGSGATARAYINSGVLSKVEVLNPGKDYKVSPRVILTGGGDSNLIPAVAYAQLYNGKVRVNQIGIKFDRITRGATLGNRKTTDSYICNGSASEFMLTWYADPDKTKITVSLNDELVLSSNYRIENYKQFQNGYTKDFSKLVLINFVPSYSQILKITYYKNVDLLNAAERIIEFYSPTSGMPGKELSQVMTGIEYPGIKIEGLLFDYTTNWDVEYSPFGKSLYAGGVGYYNQIEIVSTATAGTDTVVVSTTTNIVVGQIANIISAEKFKSSSTVFSSQVINNLTEVRVISINTASSKVTFNSTLSVSLLSTSSYVYIDNILTTVTSIAKLEVWAYDGNISALDSVIEGGSWNSQTNALTGALGVNPEDIIIDGDGFITPNTSYGPEELVPGEAHDSIGINVYTRYNEGAPTIYNGLIDVYANTITSASLIFVPPSIASIFVTFDNRNFSYTENFDQLTSINSNKFAYDWDTNILTIGPQTAQGKLGYTIVSVGGGRPNSEPGIIDYGFLVVDDGSVEAEVTSVSTTATVKSALVTVNGATIPKLETVNTTTLGYMFVTSTQITNKAAVHVYNISTSTTSTIQAWFFGTTDKYFNEFKEQIFEVDFDIKNTFVLDFPPGNIEPAAANVIVEIDDGTGYRRLQPPFISYYKVNSPNLIFNINDKIPHPAGSVADGLVRVYLNGSRLTSGIDYSIDIVNETIEIRPNVALQGDVLAILFIPNVQFNIGYFIPEFDLQGNVLTILNDTNGIFNCKLRVITFSNHDDMLVRTETFLGNLNRRFKVSRPIHNNNYVWVSVDGQLLINKIDYTVLDDTITVELSDKWHLTEVNLVVITTIASDQLADSVIGYRIFNDIFNRTHYKRLSKRNTTVLTRPLNFTDTEIHVADSDVLMPPLISKKIPGVILIDNERIEYFKIDGNVLTQLRRSTLGTSPSFYVPAGTKVVDQSPDQTIPYTDKIYKQTFLTNSSTATYTISGVNIINTGSLAGDQIISDGIILSNRTDVNPVDQIEVYYGGRKLRKTSSFYHDTTVSFDSPEFTIVGSTSSEFLLPTTDVINSAYIVTSTNQVWVYTGSVETNSVNGYVYKGLNYLEPEFSISISANTATATAYSVTALQMAVNLIPENLAYDINGDGEVSLNDSLVYLRVASGAYLENVNENSNYGTLVNQRITLNIKDGVKDNIRVTVIKKGFEKKRIWNDQLSNSTTKSLIDSSTLPARFLQAKLAELPNRYYDSGYTLIGTSSGFGITDENNDPLEGL